MWPFSEMSLASANLINGVANWFLLASLITGAVSTFFIVKTTDVKEEFWEKARHTAEGRIAELNAEAARLSAEATSARSAIAEANAKGAASNERAALAEQKAAEAQLALERFKAPRQLDPTARPRAVSKLAPYAGTNVAVFVLAEGPEAVGLGAAITDLLREAGLDAISWQWTGAGSATGVLVCAKPNEGVDGPAEAILSALTVEGVAAAALTWPGRWEEVGGMLNGPNPPNPIAPPIRVVVGSKPQ